MSRVACKVVFEYVKAHGLADADMATSSSAMAQYEKLFENKWRRMKRHYSGTTTTKVCRDVLQAFQKNTKFLEWDYPKDTAEEEKMFLDMTNETQKTAARDILLFVSLKGTPKASNMRLVVCCRGKVRVTQIRSLLTVSRSRPQSNMAVKALPQKRSRAISNHGSCSPSPKRKRLQPVAKAEACDMSEDEMEGPSRKRTRYHRDDECLDETDLQPRRVTKRIRLESDEDVLLPNLPPRVEAPAGVPRFLTALNSTFANAHDLRVKKVEPKPTKKRSIKKEADISESGVLVFDERFHMMIPRRIELWTGDDENIRAEDICAMTVDVFKLMATGHVAMVFLFAGRFHPQGVNVILSEHMVKVTGWFICGMGRADIPLVCERVSENGFPLKTMWTAQTCQ